MKKVLLLLLIAITLALICCACGSSSTPTVVPDDSDYEDDEREDEYEIPDEPSNVFDVSAIPIEELWEYPDCVEEWVDKHDYMDAFIWEDVDSEAIQEVGYSWVWEAMAVRFHSSPDTVYIYYDVPEEVFDELIFSDSVGGYYNAYIKGYYDSDRVYE